MTAHVVDGGESRVLDLERELVRDFDDLSLAEFRDRHTENIVLREICDAEFLRRMRARKQMTLDLLFYVVRRKHTKDHRGIPREYVVFAATSQTDKDARADLQLRAAKYEAESARLAA